MNRIVYDITASLVIYNNKFEDVERLLKKFKDIKLSKKLLIVDNFQCKEKTLDKLNDEEIEYIFQGKNIGYGAGNNVAIRKIINRSKYHIVLNPDVYFESIVIEELFNYAENNRDIGLIMPKIIYPNGKIQYLCKLLPSPFDLIVRKFLPYKLHAKNDYFFEMRFTGYNKIMEVPYLSGCFMFIRTEVFKTVGFFDERFFMYPEDIDLTRRIHKYYKTIFYPFVEVVHNHERASYKNIRMLFIHIMNIILYFNKWGWFFDKERKRINNKILKKYYRSS